jgi:Mg2+/Co2+ transporter CorC
VGHRLEEAVELIEMELRHAVAYVNDAVIPQVRSESISAMRKVSDTLRSLADRMEQQSPHGRRPVHGDPDEQSKGPRS